MTDFPVVRVAAVQASPVILDADATIDKVIRLFDDAVNDGAQFVAFPECFVSLYPTGTWAAAAATWTEGCDELWQRMWESAVDLRGPLMEKLVAASAARGVPMCIGINEREDDRPGSLYNTMVIIGPEGVLTSHRKLLGTMHERVFHGIGAGDDLEVVALPGVGRVGGLLCWENRMPLARWALYEQGPQIWVAPTADDSEAWQISLRAIAIEAGVFVLNVPQVIPRDIFPTDFPLPLPGKEGFGRGGACIIAPSGEVIAGPVYEAEATVMADCDLRQTLWAKRYFDVAGHYSRADVLGRQTST